MIRNQAQLNEVNNVSTSRKKAAAKQSPATLFRALDQGLDQSKLKNCDPADVDDCLLMKVIDRTIDQEPDRLRMVLEKLVTFRQWKDRYIELLVADFKKKHSAILGK